MTEASRVYSEMKQDVAMCVLAPGSSVSEAELCKRYKTSRTPVREVCRRLATEGLVQIVPFRGYTITPLTIEEYRNLYEVQSVLDPVIAGLAAERASAATFSYPKRCASEMVAMLSEGASAVAAETKPGYSPCSKLPGS